MKSNKKDEAIKALLEANEKFLKIYIENDRSVEKNSDELVKILGKIFRYTENSNNNAWDTTCIGKNISG